MIKLCLLRKLPHLDRMLYSLARTSDPCLPRYERDRADLQIQIGGEAPIEAQLLVA